MNKSMHDIVIQEQQIRSSLELLPIPIALHNLHNNDIEFLNSAFIKTFGYTLEDIPNLELWLRRAYPDEVYRRKVQETWDKAVAKATAGSQTIESIPYNVTCKNGEVRIVEIFGVPIGHKNLVLLNDITVRKRVEDTLRLRETQLNEAQRLAHIGSWDWDAVRDIIWWSDEYYRIYGFDPKKPTPNYEEHKKVYTAESAERLDAAVKRAMETGEPYEFDLELAHPTETTHWITARGEAKRNTKGEIWGLRGTAQNTTERKKIEEALRESQRRYMAIINNQTEFVSRYLSGGILTFINDTLCKYINLKREDLLGKSYYSFIHQDDRQALIRQIESLNKQNPSLVAETRIMLPSGNIVWHRWTHNAIFDDTGAIIEYQATGTDITKTKQVEDALRSSEARFRTIIENANTGIQVVDIETRKVIYANPEICRILGYSEQELRSMPVTDLAVDDEKLKPEEDFSKHAQSETHTSERTFRCKNGSLIRMSIHSVPMELEGRKCLVGFLSDVSERQLLEEERLKTQKLEAVGTLAGGIAHDFNNLLQGVFGYISLAKLKKDDREKNTAALEEAEKALHMTVTLTNQLLTFSKGGKPVKKTLDPLPVIENAAKFALSGSRSDYRLSADENLWSIDADEGQISQVIQNIVLNADQAMAEAGTIVITARNVQTPDMNLPPTLAYGKYVEINITDTGIGIPEKHLSKIFDPYFTTKEKGSGLGLATSYSIIKNHNGEIHVKSELGKGTTFLIYLPAATAAIGENKPAMAVPMTFKKGKILVMDDEEYILNIARELIQTLGHEIGLAANGAEAINIYQEAQGSGKPFDVAILDLTVRGGMGGAETVKRLLEIDPKAKAVVSSGYSDDATIASYEKQGFKAVLRKPYNVDELKDVLNKLLNA
ncbi:MAG TPA: PAS domain S-box protein [Nitrospirota bacterium]|nr:PAS domain S-box protein [Nitrospirota bacterium]